MAHRKTKDGIIKVTPDGDRWAVDLDGVVADTYNNLCRYLKVVFGLDFKYEDFTDYGLYNVPLSREQIRDIFLDEELYRSAQVKDQANIYLDNAASMGCYLHIVTARPISLNRVTEHWLQTEGIPYHGITYLVDQFNANTANAKAAVAKELGLTRFLEDSAGNAEVLIANGMSGYLLDAPYNQGLSLPNMERITDLGEVKF